jgi:hypothetical protein
MAVRDATRHFLPTFLLDFPCTVFFSSGSIFGALADNRIEDGMELRTILKGSSLTPESPLGAALPRYANARSPIGSGEFSPSWSDKTWPNRDPVRPGAYRGRRAASIQQQIRP